MITVLMATYNGVEFLQYQLDSLRLQTYKIDQVIIVDDISTDQTKTHIENYIKNYKLYNWEFYVNEKNLGHYLNFMNALKYVKGELLFFCDQDDIWDINKVKIMKDIMDNHPEITCLKSRYDSIDSTIKCVHEHTYTYKLIYPDYYKQMTNSELGCQMCFRKNILEFAITHELTQYKEFDYHDLLLSYVSSAIGINAIVDDVLLYHRYHENNATRTSTYKFCQDTINDRITLINIQSSRMLMLKTIMIKFQKKNEKLVSVIDNIVINNNNRIKFLNGSFSKLLTLARNVKCYKEVKTFIGDLLCGFKINNLIQKKH